MTTPKLQHELKKKRPFDSPEQEAALSIVRTSDQLQRLVAGTRPDYLAV
jgi:MarR family transcriptional regulator, 2-MHQ and catechol-resistance regulon repressor